MSADIGPGDVVEALVDMTEPPAAYDVHAGDRDVVVSMGNDYQRCSDCGSTEGGIVLERFWQPVGWAWCTCNWRKIGGSQADTIRQFSEDLNTKAPAPLEPVSA